MGSIYETYCHFSSCDATRLRRERRKHEHPGRKRFQDDESKTVTNPDDEEVDEWEEEDDDFSEIVNSVGQRTSPQVAGRPLGAC
jgi:hypothetical protein